MQLKHSLHLATYALLFSSAASAQADRIYHPRPDLIKVLNRAGTEMSMPWAGGMNNPQFAVADLNKDGKKDLVVFEATAGRIRTFINIGTPGTVKYKYEPKYEVNFPKGEEYIKLVDYNNDKIPDLITAIKPKLYLGYYNSANELMFNNFLKIEHTWLKTWQAGNRDVPYMSSGNVPDIIDIDGDGDIDILTFDYTGVTSMVHYYKNQKTSSMPADTIFYRWVDKCWGKFQQREYKREHNLGISCDNSLIGEKPDPSSKNTGGNHAICVFDADGDGDMDAIDGFSTSSEVQFLRNGRIEYNYPIDTMIAQDTMWQTGGKPLKLDNFPGGFWIDIDDDGDKDLLFSPLASGSENYRCVHYYKNDGSDASPNFVFQTDTLFMDNMIDVGEYAYPTLYDYNRDGKPDLFVGSSGYHRTGMPNRSQISYFSNTSSLKSPSLKQETTDFMSLSAQNLSYMAPAFGDLNTDGKDDMILGKGDGTLIFFQNMAATNGDVPNWVMKAGNIQIAGKDINVGGAATPIIYDFDKDGLKDLIVGNSSAELEYYKNMGQDASGYPKLQLVTDKLGGIHLAPFSTGNTAPFIGKIDNTNKEYLLTGNQDGVIYRYTFTPGNATAPFQRLDSFYCQISGFGLAAPTVADLDGDKKYEMIIGTKFGGLLLYEQLFDVSVDPLDKETNKISLYPNPAQQEMTLSVQGKPLQDDAVVRVYDRIGRLIRLTSLKLNQFNIQLDVSTLPQGLYMCTLTNGGELSSGSFIKK